MRTGWRSSPPWNARRAETVQCPFCKTDDTRVIDSRGARDSSAIRRRRVCDKCDRRFTTYERVEDLFPTVVKRDQRREAFDREKIRRGVQLAFKKLPVGAQQIEAIVDLVERQFADHPEREVSAAAVGEAVMARLREVDQVAYVRFASVHRQFRDVNEFMSELTQLVGEPTKADG